MKNISYIADRYTLLTKSIYLLAAVVIMCMYTVQQASAQGVNPEPKVVDDIKPLQIGDTIPPELWRIPLTLWISATDITDTILLSDFQNKWIILDFWNSYCGSCINAFPKTNDLQRRFHNEIRILAVTTEDTVRLHSMLKRRPHRKASIRESLIDDIELSSIFPHQTVPHIVVISNEGVVSDFPSNSELTESYIKQLLIDIDIQADPADIDSINKPLVKNGLIFRKAKRKVEKIQIEDINN